MVAVASLHALVTGHVQGVFFRSSTAGVADCLGCTGFARNLPDGSVEVVAEGEQPDLEKLLAYLRKGPGRARVTGVAVTWGEAQDTYRGFTVR